MNTLFTINYWTVLAAAIASMIVGALWYSPLILGRPWVRLMGFTGEAMEKAKEQNMALPYSLSFLGLLVMSYVIAHILQYAGVRNAAQAIQIAFWLWIGFIAPSLATGFLWTIKKKPFSLYLIDNGHWLAVLMVQGLILTFWS
ncbi:hypothetical protein CO046_01765 [Candidatus Peregrinibacteria bacterium CG_4_9_14_0_2_um_filter_53_11]|nr:MAG: hypothetical protein CO046_01765 [Candidatus Peregrinibacteria bacterium CG_4_9_14_0_2_um_filter_53_11]